MSSLQARGAQASPREEILLIRGVYRRFSCRANVAVSLNSYCLIMVFYIALSSIKYVSNVTVTYHRVTSTTGCSYVGEKHVRLASFPPLSRQLSSPVDRHVEPGCDSYERRGVGFKFIRTLCSY